MGWTVQALLLASLLPLLPTAAAAVACQALNECPQDAATAAATLLMLGQALLGPEAGGS
jgi:hypothetical protein